MRIWFVRVMLIGLATLPSSAYGQNTGNSYPPAPRYYAPYPNYPQAPNQQLVNQNAAPTTAMLAYMAQGSAVVQAQAGMARLSASGNSVVRCVKLRLPRLSGTYT